MSNPESLDNPSGATGAEPPFDEDGQHDPRLLTSGDAEVQPGAVDVTEADNTVPADRDDAQDTGDAEPAADEDPAPQLNDDADDNFADLPEGDDDGTDDGLDDDPADPPAVPPAN